MHPSYQTPQEMVTEFHRAAGARIAEQPSDALMEERWALIVEEFVELMLAWLDMPPTLADYVRTHLGSWPMYGTGDITCRRARAIAKELTDLAYVIYGAAVNLGIDLDRSLELVHENNMTKFSPAGEPWAVSPLGKVLKPPNHPEPDLRDALPEWLRGEEDEDVE